MSIMKKKYIHPAIYMQLVQTESLIALSFQDGEADPEGEVLVKEEKTGDDVWASPKNVWDDDWSK